MKKLTYREHDVDRDSCLIWGQARTSITCCILILLLSKHIFNVPSEVKEGKGNWSSRANHRLKTQTWRILNSSRQLGPFVFLLSDFVASDNILNASKLQFPQRSGGDNNIYFSSLLCRINEIILPKSLA